MNAPPIVIPTGGLPKAGRSGGIRPRMGGARGLWPDPSTTRCFARDDRREYAFTLIELLVVISVLVLLVSLLLPALHMARRHAQAAACQTKLHYTGLLLAVYVHDHDGMLPPSYNAAGPWPFTYEPNPAYPELALCPAATTLAPRERLPWGDTFEAWTADLNSNDFEHGLWRKDFNMLGSYGRNGWAFLHGGAGKSAWGTTLVRQAYEIPLYMDCTTPNMGPFPYDSPPEHEDADRDWSMSCACIDRHNGGINTLFMDWSVRKVGLKELWMFKWHRQFDTAGPWTRAGGVTPEDWPQWMRKFKDY